jgi:hypothetical protein
MQDRYVIARRSPMRKGTPGAPGPKTIARIASYDVFDTLLTRVWLRPADVFLHAGLLLGRRGLVRISPERWRTFAAIERSAHTQIGMRSLQRGSLGERLAWTALNQLEKLRGAAENLRLMVMGRKR